MYSILREDGNRVPLLITNRHVLEACDSLQITIRIQDGLEDGSPRVGESLITVNVTGVQEKAIYHSNPLVDLAAIPAAPMLNGIRDQGEKPFVLVLERKQVANDDELQQLNAVEEILMLGFPIGLIDPESNLPLVRRGITSTPPGVGFHEDHIGVVDIACFPGSSGSPILIITDGSYSLGGTLRVGQRVILLGVLFGGPFHTNDGQFCSTSVPLEQSREIQHMVHLGYYVHAREILDLEAQVNAIVLG